MKCTKIGGGRIAIPSEYLFFVAKILKPCEVIVRCGGEAQSWLMGLIASSCSDLFGAEWLFMVGKTGLSGAPALVNIGKSDSVAVSWMLFHRPIVHS